MEILFKTKKSNFGTYVVLFLKDCKKMMYNKSKYERKKYVVIPWQRAFFSSVRMLMQENMTVLDKVALRGVAHEYGGEFENDISLIRFSTRKQAQRFIDDILQPQAIAQKLMGVELNEKR